MVPDQAQANYVAGSPVPLPLQTRPWFLTKRVFRALYRDVYLPRTGRVPVQKIAITIKHAPTTAAATAASRLSTVEFPEICGGCVPSET